MRTRCGRAASRFEFGHRPMGGGVAVQGNQPRCPMLPDGSGKEPLGCCDVPALAQEKVDRSTSFIHCAIEVHPLAFDLDIGLVHTPGVAHRSRMLVPALFKVRHVPLAPIARWSCELAKACCENGCYFFALAGIRRSLFKVASSRKRSWSWDQASTPWRTCVSA